MDAGIDRAEQKRIRVAIGLIAIIFTLTFAVFNLIDNEDVNKKSDITDNSKLDESMSGKFYNLFSFGGFGILFRYNIALENLRNADTSSQSEIKKNIEKYKVDLKQQERRCTIKSVGYS